MYLKSFRAKKLVAFRQWSRKPYAVFSSLKLLIKISVLSVAYTLVNPVQECKAQADSTSAVKKLELDEVEVTGQRTPVVASQAARIVTVISRSEIEQAPAQSINELLENVPQVDIRQRGVNGVQADISIQGGSFDQTLILLNGINLTDPQTGHHNLNLPISISSINRVEILKGPASRVYGPNAFAGAVNFITGETPHNSFQYSITGGQYGFYSGNLNFNLNSKQMNHFLGISKSASDGYITNTDFDMFTLFYHGKLNINKSLIGLQLGYVTKDFGANSFYSPRLPHQFESNQTYFGSINSSFGKLVKITPSVYWRRNYDKFIYNRTNPASAGNYHYTDVYGINSNFTYSTSWGKSTLGADYRKELIYSGNLGLPLSENEYKKVPGENNKYYTYHAWRNNVSVFLEQTLNVPKWNISAGIMANKNTELNKIGLFPGADISYKLLDSWIVYGTINRSLRLPTYTNLYYSSKSQKILGNDGLLPETAWITEMGIKAGTDVLSGSLSYFHKWGQQTIDYIWRDTVWHAENITQLNTDGLEATLQIDPSNNYLIQKITFSYSLNLQSKASGNLQSLYVLDQLKHKMVATVMHRIYKKINAYWQVSVQERGGYYDYYNPVDFTTKPDVYDPFVLVDSRITWSPLDIKLFVECTNILDANYIDIGNVYQPGRWLKLGLELKINN